MRILKAGLILMGSAFILQPVHAAGGTPRAQIQEQMARFQQAFRHKDISAVRAITTPDFTMKSPSGRKSTRSQAEVAIAADMKAIRSISEWILRIDKIVVTGNTAWAIVSEHMKANVADSSGFEHPSVSSARMREKWVKTPAGWRYQYCEAISEKSGPADVEFVSPSEIDTKTPRYIAARKAIEAQYAAYKKAVRNKDLGGAMATMTNDVSEIFPDGRTLDRRKYEASLRTTLSELRSVRSWELKIARMSVAKDTAVVDIGERLVTTFINSGKLHDQTLVDFYRDTWVKTAHGWRLRNTRIIRVDVTLDGKTTRLFG